MTQRRPNWRAIIVVLVTFTIVAQFFFLLALDLVTINQAWHVLGSTSALSTTMFLLWLIYDFWLWRFAARMGLLAWPDLNGVWKGTVHYGLSIEAQLDDGRRDEVTITIRQTSSTISATYLGMQTEPPLENPTSQCITRSTSNLAELFRDDSGTVILRFVYETLPGSAYLHIPGMIQGTYTPGPPAQLNGEWIAHPESPGSGTIAVTLQSRPHLLWPFRSRLV
jgi:hypothetical protein